MGKYSDCWTYPMEVIDEKFSNVVSKETTVNNKPLSGNVTLAANDVGAVANTSRSLSSGDDLNTLVTPDDNGFYYIGAGVSHAPQDWCALIVITRTTGGCTQIAISSTTLYYRQYTGSPLAWSNWRSLTGDVVE